MLVGNPTVSLAILGKRILAKRSLTLIKLLPLQNLMGWGVRKEDSRAAGYMNYEKPLLFGAESQRSAVEEEGLGWWGADWF